MCKIAEIIRKFQDEERRCNLKEILAELEININKHIEKKHYKQCKIFHMN
jgi:predicted XRE-type DNA-binding protein